MAKHVWTVLCKRAIVDFESNVLSMIDILEEAEIHAQEPKDFTGAGLGIEAYLVTMLLADENEKSTEYKSVAYGPKGKIAFEGPTLKIDFKGKKRSRTISLIGRLPIDQGVGTYYIHTKLKQVTSKGKFRWVEVAKTPLDVRFVPPITQEKKATA